MRDQTKWAACALLALGLITGCGAADNGGTGGASAAGQQPGAGQQQPPGGGDFAQMGGMAFDLMGKIKSVDGHTITVYKSAFAPGDGGMGGRPGGGQGGGQPEPPSGERQPPAGATQPGNEVGGQPSARNGDRPANGSGQGPMGMEDMFTDETVDIVVTETTRIVKREFSDDGPIETELSIADLQADEIVTVDLQDDTQEALTITVGNGGMGMGMGGGMAGRRGQAQESQ